MVRVRSDEMTVLYHVFNPLTFVFCFFPTRKANLLECRIIPIVFLMLYCLFVGGRGGKAKEMEGSQQTAKNPSWHQADIVYKEKKKRKDKKHQNKSKV